MKQVAAAAALVTAGAPLSAVLSALGAPPGTSGVFFAAVGETLYIVDPRNPGRRLLVVPLEAQRLVVAHAIVSYAAASLVVTGAPGAAPVLHECERCGFFVATTGLGTRHASLRSCHVESFGAQPLATALQVLTATTTPFSGMEAAMAWLASHCPARWPVADGRGRHLFAAGGGSDSLASDVVSKGRLPSVMSALAVRFTHEVALEHSQVSSNGVINAHYTCAHHRAPTVPAVPSSAEAAAYNAAAIASTPRKGTRCPFQVRIIAPVDGGALSLVSLVDEHNHDTSRTSFGLHPLVEHHLNASLMGPHIPRAGIAASASSYAAKVDAACNANAVAVAAGLVPSAAMPSPSGGVWSLSTDDAQPAPEMRGKHGARPTPSGGTSSASATATAASSTAAAASSAVSSLEELAGGGKHSPARKEFVRQLLNLSLRYSAYNPIVTTLMVQYAAAARTERLRGGATPDAALLHMLANDKRASVVWNLGPDGGVQYAYGIVVNPDAAAFVNSDDLMHSALHTDATHNLSKYNTRVQSVKLFDPVSHHYVLVAVAVYYVAGKHPGSYLQFIEWMMAELTRRMPRLVPRLFVVDKDVGEINAFLRHMTTKLLHACTAAAVTLKSLVRMLEAAGKEEFASQGAVRGIAGNLVRNFGPEGLPVAEETMLTVAAATYREAFVPPAAFNPAQRLLLREYFNEAWLDAHGRVALGLVMDLLGNVEFATAGVLRGVRNWDDYGNSTQSLLAYSPAVYGKPSSLAALVKCAASRLTLCKWHVLEALRRRTEVMLGDRNTSLLLEKLALHAADGGDVSLAAVMELCKQSSSITVPFGEMLRYLITEWGPDSVVGTAPWACTHISDIASFVHTSGALEGMHAAFKTGRGAGGGTSALSDGTAEFRALVGEPREEGSVASSYMSQTLAKAMHVRNGTVTRTAVEQARTMEMLVHTTAARPGIKLLPVSHALVYGLVVVPYGKPSVAGAPAVVTQRCALVKNVPLPTLVHPLHVVYPPEEAAKLYVGAVAPLSPPLPPRLTAAVSEAAKLGPEDPSMSIMRSHLATGHVVCLAYNTCTCWRRSSCVHVIAAMHHFASTGAPAPWSLNLRHIFMPRPPVRLPRRNSTAAPSPSAVAGVKRRRALMSVSSKAPGLAALPHTVGPDAAAAAVRAARMRRSPSAASSAAVRADLERAKALRPFASLAHGDDAGGAGAASSDTVSVPELVPRPRHHKEWAVDAAAVRADIERKERSGLAAPTAATGGGSSGSGSGSGFVGRRQRTAPPALDLDLVRASNALAVPYFVALQRLLADKAAAPRAAAAAAAVAADSGEAPGMRDEV